MKMPIAMNRFKIVMLTCLTFIQLTAQSVRANTCSAFYGESINWVNPNVPRETFIVKGRRGTAEFYNQFEGGWVQKSINFKLNLPNNKTVTISVPTSNQFFLTTAIRKLEVALSATPLSFLKRIDKITFVNGFSHMESPYWRGLTDAEIAKVRGRIVLAEYEKYGAGDKNESTLFFGLWERSDREVAEAILHESGHLIAHELYGSSLPPRDYEVASKKDNMPISEYGEKNSKENFAEFVRAYVATRGTQKEQKFRSDHAHKIAFLENQIRIDPEFVNVKLTLP